MLNSVLFVSVYEGSGQFMVIAVVALVVLKVLISALHFVLLPLESVERQSPVLCTVPRHGIQS